MKLFFIINYGILALLTFAVIGASGHQIFNFKNAGNVQMLLASSLFFIIFILFLIARAKLSVSLNYSIKVLLVLAIITKLIIAHKIYVVSALSNADSIIGIVYLLIFIGFDIYWIIRKRLTVRS